MISLPIEMPKCCPDCPIWNYEFQCCNILKISSWEPGQEYDPYEGRQSGCPLQEVDDEDV